MNLLRAITTFFLIYSYNLFFLCEAKLTISIYYETHCGWSKKLLLEQVHKTNVQLGKYIKWDLVPYGFAKKVERNGELINTCHHGEPECRGNKIHACILNQPMESQHHKMNMIHCVIQTTYKDEEISQCATGIFNAPNAFEELRNCYTDLQGEFLIEGYGVRTKLMRLKGVPYVTYDGFSNDTLAAKTWTMFRTSCELMEFQPPPCQEFITTIVI